MSHASKAEVAETGVHHQLAITSLAAKANQHTSQQPGVEDDDVQFISSNPVRVRQISGQATPQDYPPQQSPEPLANSQSKPTATTVTQGGRRGSPEATILPSSDHIEMDEGDSKGISSMRSMESFVFPQSFPSPTTRPSRVSDAISPKQLPSVLPSGLPQATSTEQLGLGASGAEYDTSIAPVQGLQHLPPYTPGLLVPPNYPLTLEDSMNWRVIRVANHDYVDPLSLTTPQEKEFVSRPIGEPMTTDAPTLGSRPLPSHSTTTDNFSSPWSARQLMTVPQSLVKQSQCLGSLQHPPVEHSGQLGPCQAHNLQPTISHGCTSLLRCCARCAEKRHHESPGQEQKPMGHARLPAVSYTYPPPHAGNTYATPSHARLVSSCPSTATADAIPLLAHHMTPSSPQPGLGLLASRLSPRPPRATTQTPVQSLQAANGKATSSTPFTLITPLMPNQHPAVTPSASTDKSINRNATQGRPANTIPPLPESPAPPAASSASVPPTPTVRPPLLPPPSSLLRAHPLPPSTPTPSSTPAQTASAKRKAAQHLIVDVAETVQEVFPFDEVAKRHCVARQKVADALDAVVRLPLLRCVTDKRRAGKLGTERMRQFREYRKAHVARQVELMRHQQGAQQSQQQQQQQQQQGQGQLEQQKGAVKGSEHKKKTMMDLQAEKGAVAPPSAFDLALLADPAEMPKGLLG